MLHCVFLAIILQPGTLRVNFKKDYSSPSLQRARFVGHDIDVVFPDHKIPPYDGMDTHFNTPFAAHLPLAKQAVNK